MARQLAGLAANPPALTRQYLFLSFACSIADIPPAAGALYPFPGLRLSPVVAAGAMALSSGQPASRPGTDRHGRSDGQRRVDQRLRFAGFLSPSQRRAAARGRQA